MSFSRAKLTNTTRQLSSLRRTVSFRLPLRISDVCARHAACTEVPTDVRTLARQKQKGENVSLFKIRVDLRERYNIARDEVINYSFFPARSRLYLIRCVRTDGGGDAAIYHRDLIVTERETRNGKLLITLNCVYRPSLIDHIALIGDGIVRYFSALVSHYFSRHSR